ncbi:RNA polymerase sigma factor [Flagellimonas zhangzhouensis]|uniref:RNA polymerase sigma-70 factor, ECF subfamily n=1 Tax=Flagellimonas zhangzhouensis TaxID=1073328 RepID=A0A1H2UBB2_9FLAO|nr:RNA polymerase sigma factor [Allomuricauda zhangzhouensis]SDQ18504.1 RNA polymerase sigma-70 factor, ECF subfamily [Allomuricauda zhangzhouensis]SDW53415.1 RNA polymerase sigma-70 factor, ECF subfamily [Allomuricauda zhangzhouensis]
METLSDEMIMQKVSEGNLDLLKVLFDRHHKHVYNFLYKMSGDQMLAEDLTQDVFYKLIKYRNSYNNGSFLSWLFTIARNNLKTHYTRNHKSHDDIEVLAYKAVEEENDVSENNAHLQYALSQLDPEDRELVILNRYKEIKYDELAEIFGSTPGAVKTRVCRILKKLKNIYLESI